MQKLDDQVKTSAGKLDTISQNQDAVMSQQTVLRTAQSAFADELKDLKEQVSNQALDTSQITQIFNELIIEQLKTLATKDDVKQIEEQVSNAGPTIPSVYFTAYATGHHSSSGAMPFPTIVADNNSGYVKETGIVKIQVAGVYHFSYSLMKWASKGIDVYIRHNNKDVCGSYSSDTSNYQSVSCSATFSVQVNDEVYVRLSSGQIHAGVRSSFTGYMISP